MQHAALGGGQGEVVAHDGKSLKGSYDTAHDQKMSQVFRAFAVGTKIILGHLAIMVKSNENPGDAGIGARARPGGCGLHRRCDALPDQDHRGGKGGRRRGAASGQSQPASLEAAVEALPGKREPRDCHVETGEIRRNRQEKRVVEVFRAGSILELPEWQTHAVEAVRVTRTVLHKDVATGWKWRPTREVAWYASTRDGNSAAYYAAATRGHWGVENRVHYVLDVSMHEDASRVRKSPTILSILRSFALNILRFNKINDIANALWRNAMNLNRVLAYGGT